MNDVIVHIKGAASGHVRAGSTVGEALERFDPDVATQALAAKVNGREVDLAFRLQPGVGDAVVEIEPVLPATPEGSTSSGIRPRTSWPRRCSISSPERSSALARPCSTIRASASFTT